MKFTIHRLINTSSKSTVGYEELFEAFGKTQIVPFNKNNIDYIFNVELNEDYCFIEVKHGKTDAKDCFDKKENIFKNNILGKDMVHTDEQFFIFMEFSNHDVALLSDFEKKGVLLAYMKEKGMNIKIIDVSSNIDKFADNINTFSSVKIKLTNNLFLQNYFSPKFNEDWDNKLPDSCELKLKFNCKLDKKVIKERFNSLNNDCCIEEVEFEGEDNENRLLVINRQALIMKQDINIQKGDNGYYDPNAVKNKLLELNK